MRHITLIFALSLNIIGFSQEYELVNNQTVKLEFEKISKKYQSVNFQIDFVKSIYRDSLDNEVMVQTKGKIARGKGYEYRMEENGLIVIQNNHIKVTIDSATQTVSIVKPDTLFKAIDMGNFLTEESFENYSFRRMENKGVIRYLIIPKNRLEGITELWIKVNDFSLQKLILSLPKANYFNESLEDETLESPLVVINYQPLKVLDKISVLELFQQDEWLLEENNKYSLHPSKGMFEIHDLRYNPQ
jgi:hypothetical protein